MIFRGRNRPGSIRDDDIHGYSDSLLDPVRRRQVERHLAADSADAERVRTYRRINGGLADLRRSMQDDEAACQFAALTEDLSKALVRQRQFRRTVGGATLSLFLLVAASGAWVLTETGPETGSDNVQAAALETALSSWLPEEFIEISGAESEDEVMTWISRQVDPGDFAAPDLNSAGFTLSGARVVPTSHGPLVEFHYRDDSKTPLTFSVSGSDINRGHSSLAEDSERQMAVYWRDGALVYSLIGPMRHSDLTKLADLVAGEAAASSEKSATAKEASQSASLAAENSGLLLVDSKTESPASGSSSSRRDEDISKEADPVKPPPVTVEKIEEPKPL